MTARSRWSCPTLGPIRSGWRSWEDRDRIAQDLHDHVIQRLFATGLSVQVAARLTEEPGLSGALDSLVDPATVADAGAVVREAAWPT